MPLNTKKSQPQILLSFDTEEFDLPLEYGYKLAENDQLGVSKQGTELIQELLEEEQIKATFFCTVRFALNSREQIATLAKVHEIGSHTYFHSKFEQRDLKASKEVLESLCGKEVCSFRMPRMAPVNNAALISAGYRINSSLNPTLLPGKYNHYRAPRRWFFEEGLLQVPASVSPLIRFPLFWLSFHHVPFPIMQYLCLKTIKSDGYLNLYFHPWEFTDLRSKYGLPYLITKASGTQMLFTLKQLIKWLKTTDAHFVTFGSFSRNLPPHPNHQVRNPM